MECLPQEKKMKTLDEVIIGIREQMGFGDPILVDALHYLKEFQGLSKMWNNKLDKEQENPPLDWETLKQMVEKPIWVEEKGMLSIWIIIRDVTENWLYSTDCNAYHHEEYGKIWNAYRKERV